MKNQSASAVNKGGFSLSRFGGQKVMVLLVIIVLFAFFSIMSPAFRRYTTIISILDYSYYIVLMSIGVTFPLITGGVDLSIGTGLICYSLVGGFLVQYHGAPVWGGMIVTVLMGIAIGTVNGCVVAIMGIPPFLTTLCTCMITRGLGAIIVGGFGITWPTAIQPGGWIRSIFKITLADQTKIPILQLNIMGVPDMPGVVANQCYIKSIRHNHRKILPVD